MKKEMAVDAPLVGTAAQTPTISRKKRTSWSFTFFLFISLVVAAVAVLYGLDPYDPVALPLHELTQPRPPPAPRQNSRMLDDSRLIGVGTLVAPEDLVYDPDSGIIYTGCMDGWIKRVRFGDSAEPVVENWVRLGGRPLGVALGHDKELIVAHADQGLLNVSREGEVKFLTDEAEGVKFKLTDGVDIADDGLIYFTDASYKYSFSDFVLDIFEGRPYGRLLSYDPSTKLTKVLLRDLYFPNGVALSSDQNSAIFCETVMRRCSKYHLKGEKKGKVEGFIENMPGTPDNIKYDGEGKYWIALSTEYTQSTDLVFKYPSIRKFLAILERYNMRPRVEANGGVLAVDLEGNPVAHFYDKKLSMVSSGLKIGNRLYCGSVADPQLICFNLNYDEAKALL